MTKCGAAFTLLSYALITRAAQPSPWQLDFQPPATANMQDMIELWHFTLLILSSIFLTVAGLLIYICIKFNRKANPHPANFNHNTKLEIIWTLLACLILTIITVPSLRLLAEVHVIPEADFTVKVIGYQWYWHYNYPDHDNLSYDSYLVREADLKPGQLRLLEVDNRLVLPVDTIVRFVVTSGDVIHSFAVPAAGIKIDAIPGRVNETWVNFRSQGIYYGQCSELCGIDHGFMPIAVEVVSKEHFRNWIKSSLLINPQQ